MLPDTCDVCARRSAGGQDGKQLDERRRRGCTQASVSGARFRVGRGMSPSVGVIVSAQTHVRSRVDPRTSQFLVSAQCSVPWVAVLSSVRCAGCCRAQGCHAPPACPPPPGSRDPPAWRSPTSSDPCPWIEWEISVPSVDERHTVLDCSCASVLVHPDDDGRGTATEEEDTGTEHRPPRPPDRGSDL